MKNPYYNRGFSIYRNNLNYFLYKHRNLYHGIVLDIGGRELGINKALKKNVDKWIIADIDGKTNPDIKLDVTEMPQIEKNSIDVINANELFEHVYNINQGLSECARVLKKDGLLIVSVPFLHYVHGIDYQRWTYIKWKKELKNYGFHIEKFIILGKFYSYLSEMLKTLIIEKTKNLSLFKVILRRLSFPILDLIAKFDTKRFVKNNPKLNAFHCGYFIIARNES